MKKVLLVMAAAAMVAGTNVLANSTTVTSVNVVGYYQVTIPENTLALVTPILETWNSADLNDLIGDQLPIQSRVSIWNRLSSTYDTATRLAFRVGAAHGWPTNTLVLRGDAMFLRPPPDSGDWTVTFMGDVPGSYNDAGTTTVHNISGVAGVGYTYPVDILWKDTTLSQTLPIGSSFIWWDDGWTSYTKFGGIGWGAAGDITIKAGTAFFVRLPSSDMNTYDWEEEVPYSL